METVEDSDVAFETDAGRADHRWTAEFFLTSSDVERVQAVHNGAVFHRLSYEVNRTRCRINGRGPGYPFLTGGTRTWQVLSAGRGNSGCRISEIHPPQGRSEVVVGIEGIDRISHGGHVNDVVDALPGNVHCRHKKWLRNGREVQWIAEQQSKSVLIHIGRREQGLVYIGAGSLVV